MVNFSSYKKAIEQIYEEEFKLSDTEEEDDDGKVVKVERTEKELLENNDKMLRAIG